MKEINCTSCHKIVVCENDYDKKTCEKCREKSRISKEKKTAEKKKCVATIYDNSQCKNLAQKDSEYCGSHSKAYGIQHVETVKKSNNVCKSLTSIGEQCTFKAIVGGDYCKRHLKQKIALSDIKLSDDVKNKEKKKLEHHRERTLKQLEQKKIIRVSKKEISEEESSEEESSEEEISSESEGEDRLEKIKRKIRQNLKDKREK